MLKKLILGISISFLVLTFTGSALAAPSNLVVTPISGYEVELYWDKGNEFEAYNVWMSKNGRSWEKLNRQSVTNTVYKVGYEKIEPWVNYYFLVTNSNVTLKNGSNPLDGVVSQGKMSNATRVQVAFPPGENIHGNYKSNTSSCSKCHRSLHVPAAASMLESETVNDTCSTCHDGTGAKYNVSTGQVAAGDVMLNSAAGPFGNIFDSTKATIPVKSIHSADDSILLNTVPPGYKDKKQGDWNKPFGCGSCHDAHDSGNYRMLRRVLPGNPLDADGKPINIKIEAFAETDKLNKTENIYYKSGINQFCIGCHIDFDKKISAGGSEKADNGNYKHPIGVSPSSYLKSGQPWPLTTSLPLEGNEADYNDNKIICLTCHNAHGSNTLTLETRRGYKDGGNNEINYLLRRDFRGVCQDCHQK